MPGPAEPPPEEATLPCGVRAEGGLALAGARGGGGAAAGFRTALVTGYGFFDGADPANAIAESGIVPDFILDRP